MEFSCQFFNSERSIPPNLASEGPQSSSKDLPKAAPCLPFTLLRPRASPLDTGNKRHDTPNKGAIVKQACKLLLAALSLAAALPAQRPPVIDRELFFGDPEISSAQISPDGKYIAFLKPWNQTRNIWVKRSEEPFDAARLVTADSKRPIPGYFWSRDSHFILFAQDAAGDENYNVYAVNPADPPAAGAAAPPARNLTEAKGVRAVIYSVPRTAPAIIYVGLNDRDKAWHDLYEVKIATGERKLLRRNTDRITGWFFDNKDQIRLASRSADNGDTQILRVDPDGLKMIYGCSVFETCQPSSFEKQDKQVYLVTNKGEPNLVGLALLNPQTGQTSLVEADPMKRVDFSGAIISEVTHDLVATIYNDERLRFYWKDKDWQADYQRIQKQLPG
ncbi:MAG TPA: hypothetical protein VGS58_16090, partial [Candidatus Sulfopaludibacter sp.]|nr:hypothetical protein [Candidatus Sulfopaludibacter sp.]